jgi:hypothetical protein
MLLLQQLLLQLLTGAVGACAQVCAMALYASCPSPFQRGAENHLLLCAAASAVLVVACSLLQLLHASTATADHRVSFSKVPHALGCSTRPLYKQSYCNEDSTACSNKLCR